MTDPQRLNASRLSPPRPFGERLRALRQARMLTQAELAALIGVHQQEVSRWERGRTLPYPATRRQIAHALGLRPHEL